MYHNTSIKMTAEVSTDTMGAKKKKKVKFLYSTKRKNIIILDPITSENVLLK